MKNDSLFEMVKCRDHEKQLSAMTIDVEKGNIADLWNDPSNAHTHSRFHTHN